MLNSYYFMAIECIDVYWTCVHHGTKHAIRGFYILKITKKGNHIVIYIYMKQNNDRANKHYIYVYVCTCMHMYVHVYFITKVSFSWEHSREKTHSWGRMPGA